MMDYTAGQNRLQGSAVSNEPVAGSSLNPTRPRTQTVGGGLGMNSSAGGTHVLLFERDQQFAALLTSELQLVGYECHTARTAVEVFDAIARYSIRLVLVNLAQAAAARREFWVALDTQRRGRGVQVLTFHCSNLAGYGPTSDDPDDRSHIMLADLEVDGMLGIMNMVNAIRSRIAVSNTGSIARTASSPGNDSRSQSNSGTSEENKTTQSTMPLPTATNNGLSSSVRNNTPTPPPVIPDLPPPSPFSPAAETLSSPPRTTLINHTDKIRAVIYPNQRSWSTQRDADSLNHQNNQGGQNNPYMNTTSSVDTLADRQAKNEETSWQPQKPAEQKESGLAQLSRMVQEHHIPVAETTETAETIPSTSNGQDVYVSPLSETTMQQQRVRPPQATAISTLPLRASPIEDLPTDRIIGNARGVHTESGSATTRPDGPATGNTHPNNPLYQPASTLASIAKPISPVSSLSSTPSLPTVGGDEDEEHQLEHLAHERDTILTRDRQQQSTIAEQEQENHLMEQSPTTIQERTQQSPMKAGGQKPSAERSDTLPDLMPTQPQQDTEAAPIKPATDSTLLLDIVQSLPAMSSPPPPQQMLSGRATRSLGSVLLEGHLVPKDRLEVAQGIQRMLRGVDMNYQLGEILLMFKLLTPDQLLAASLVSYGLITTTQIIALGRIRQELHSIGLEYDLENLLILFRILTSEQLREVRSSWTS